MKMHYPAVRLCAWFFAVACTSLASLADAAPLPAGVKSGPSAEGISQYQLQNGMQVLLFPDQSKPSTTVNITYLVGSRHENYGETGMAHLLEHLLFKGTPKNLNIPQEMSKRGMQFNGTTALDRTNYYASFAANPANLEWALALEADRMVNSFIAQKDLASEMSVVRNEYESGENSPGNVLLKRLLNLAFDWHNVGKPTIGNRSDIENVKIANLQAFYRRYYQPDNAVLLVAGKFDADKTLALIAKQFGKIAKPTRQLPVLWTTEPTQDGERSVTIRRKGSVQMIALGYKVPGALHADNDAIAAAADMLSDASNGRLHKILVETGRATQVFSYQLSGVDPGMLLVGAIVKEGEPIEPVREALIGAMENFTAPSSEELARFKRRTQLQIEQTMNDPQSLAVALSESISLGDWRLLLQARDQLEKLSAEQVGTAAQRYFKRDNRSVANFLPEDKPQRAEIPASPSAAQAMQGFVAKQPAKKNEEFDVSQANLDARTHLHQIGKVKLALLPKQSRGEQVEVHLQLHWGDADNLQGKAAVSQITRAMLMRGSSKYSRQQLADEMDKLKMAGGITQFSTTREHLPAALQLACHVLQQPAFPDSELQQLKKQLKVNLESAKTDPQALAMQATQEHFNAWPAADFRAVRSVQQQLDDLEKISVADLRAFHQEFYGASQGEVAIVGDFDETKALQTLQKCFEAWPSRANYARLPERLAQVPVVRKLINTPDKENAVYVSNMGLDLARDDADFPLLMLASEMFGGGELSSRLMDRVRQKEGLSYGIGSSFSAGQIDRVGSFGIYAISAPQNVAKLEQAVQEELQRARSEGFTAAELARAKNGLLQQRKLARAQDATLASGWVSLLYVNHTFAYSRELDEKLQAATLEQVNQAFQRLIEPKKMSVFIALDQAKQDKDKQ